MRSTDDSIVIIDEERIEATLAHGAQKGADAVRDILAKASELKGLDEADVVNGDAPGIGACVVLPAAVLAAEAATVTPGQAMPSEPTSHCRMRSASPESQRPFSTMSHSGR